MRCASKFAGEACSLEYGHGPLHMSVGGKVVWSELQLEDYDDGFERSLLEEEDPNGPITSVVQYYAPFSHVIVTRKPITRMQRNCKHCRSAGIIYDPMTAESEPCPSCQPRSG